MVGLETLVDASHIVSTTPYFPLLKQEGDLEKSCLLLR